MIFNFKLFPYFNISQNFVQNVQKQKNTFVLSWVEQFLKFYSRIKRLIVEDSPKINISQDNDDSYAY